MSSPTLRSVLTSILAILVLFSSAAPGQAPATDELTRLQQENQQLRAENQNLLIQGQPAAPTAPRSAPGSSATVPATVPVLPGVVQGPTLDHWLTTGISISRCWSVTSRGQSVEARKAEIRALKDYYVQVQDENRHDNDVLLCGDFNRNLGDPGYLSELLTLPSMVDTTSRNVPTKVDSSNTYDHLLFQSSFTKEFTGRHGLTRTMTRSR